MGKRTPKLSDEWLHDVWNVRELDHGEGELADFDRLISSAVSLCLKGKDRQQIAGQLSEILGEEVSGHMLNAYASEARSEHKIPASRFLALMAMMNRFDLLDAVLRDVGAKALDRHDTKEFLVGKDYIASLVAARTLRLSAAELFDPIEP